MYYTRTRTPCRIDKNKYKKGKKIKSKEHSVYYFVIELIVKCVDYWNPLDDGIGKVE